MPSRFSQGVNKVKKCHQGVPLVFKEIDNDIIRFWDKVVSPKIKKLNWRVDTSWSWRQLMLREYLLGKAMGQKPEALAICVENSSLGIQVPVALMLLAIKYNIINGKGTYVFVWYFSTAPVDGGLGKLMPAGYQPKPKDLGEIILDTAIGISINNRYNGRILLHAAKPVNGQDRLPSFYSGFGLKMVPDKKKRISRVRKNDGRYFYSSKSIALKASKRHDCLR